VQEPYAALRLSELSQGETGWQQTGELSSSLRQYLYDKYVYRSSGEATGAEPARLSAVAGGS
jgi:hypothetical protein